MVAGMEIPEDFKLAAKKGAAFLDEARPGWAEAVNPITLELGFMDQCVLGQLYGDYNQGLSELEVPSHHSVELGFNLRVRRPWDWVKLTRAWVEQIWERRV